MSGPVSESGTSARRLRALYVQHCLALELHDVRRVPLAELRAALVAAAAPPPPLRPVEGRLPLSMGSVAAMNLQQQDSLQHQHHQQSHILAHTKSALNVRKAPVGPLSVGVPSGSGADLTPAAPFGLFHHSLHAQPLPIPPPPPAALQQQQHLHALPMYYAPPHANFVSPSTPGSVYFNAPGMMATPQPTPPMMSGAGGLAFAHSSSAGGSLPPGGHMQGAGHSLTSPLTNPNFAILGGPLNMGMGGKLSLPSSIPTSLSNSVNQVAFLNSGFLHSGSALTLGRTQSMPGSLPSSLPASLPLEVPAAAPSFLLPSDLSVVIPPVPSVAASGSGMILFSLSLSLARSLTFFPCLG